VSKLENKIIFSQTKEVICSVIKFLEEEGIAGSFAVPGHWGL
jgi:hypothetical protein